MAHLDDGALQAYLDGEITGRDRAATAEHLLTCGECRGRLDALKRANQRLTSALAALDVAAPAEAPRRPLSARSRLGVGGWSVVRAAVLVLVLAAAASASVPGSPVREWIAQVVRPAGPAAEMAPATPPEAPAPAPSPAVEPAGISVPGLRDMDVVVTGLEGATIRLVRSGAPGLSVSARGGERDPLFRMGTGRIEVVGGVGGELRIEMPGSGGGLRLFVDGRPYAQFADEVLRLSEPAEREGDDVVWR